MADLPKFMILYHMQNHKLGGSSSIIASAYCSGPLNFLNSQELRDFCFNYLRAYWLKNVKRPFKLNDFEVMVNEADMSVTMYHHKNGYKVNYTCADLERIATLRLSKVPVDKDYEKWCELTGDEYADLYKIWK